MLTRVLYDMSNQKIVAIVQARLSSKRFPNKVLKSICDKSIIEWVISRLKICSTIDKICVATTTDPSDDKLVDFLSSQNILVYRGSVEDVLSRFYFAATFNNASHILRITADCPFVDPVIISEIINFYWKNDSLDYVSNTLEETFPDGLDVEFFTYEALKWAHEEAKSQFEREHVTPYMKEKLATGNISSKYPELSRLRLTIDEPIDLEVLNEIASNLGCDQSLSFSNIAELKRLNPKKFEANIHIRRNEGSIMNSGDKIWRRAKSIIPGGSMLFSKGQELFVPKIWPTYYKKCKGISVWDIDSNHYLDFSYMGIGTNTLGYGCNAVDEAVLKSIGKGNLCTLNNPDEVRLAEELIEFNPGQDMVRFTRSGGEANAVAIRIARAASGRSKVAVCGYHGWHDWYLSANLESDDNLKNHLLAGLSINGVPEKLSGLTQPFFYNDISALKKIMSENDIGVVKMEVYRNTEPNKTFLKDVRRLCDQYGAVLIFDECTSGFRETFGGIYKKYNVTPDMIVYGKTLGNGYAINAVLGKRQVMEAAQSTFISSTFWTEAIGTAAALATLKEMRRLKSWKIITELGEYFRKGLLKVAKRNSLEIQTNGLASIQTFSFDKWHNQRKTFLTKEMLSLGWLATTAFYASTEHSKERIDDYLTDLDKIFETLKGMDFDDALTLKNLGDLCQTGFKRLN